MSYTFKENGENVDVFEATIADLVVAPMTFGKTSVSGFYGLLSKVFVAVVTVGATSAYQTGSPIPKRVG